jgi:hypothetical protein
MYQRPRRIAANDQPPAPEPVIVSPEFTAEEYYSHPPREEDFLLAHLAWRDT